MNRIVVLDGFATNPGDLNWDFLSNFGEYKVYERSNPDEIIERAKEANIILTNKALITKHVIENLPHLKYISVLATGVNIVDLDEAKAKGIQVSNVPAYSTDSVAQLVFAHLLNFSNRVEYHSQSVQAGKWENCKDFSYSLSPQIELSGKIFGVLGFGHTGQAVARLAYNFGMKVLVSTRSEKQIDFDVTYVEKQELFKNSDFLSIHCALTPETSEIVNESNLKLMKRSAFIINTSRGGTVNENDLSEALNNGQISGAGLDVLSTEPPAEDNPLLRTKNCYITPHVAWATLEARTRLLEVTRSNIESYLKGDTRNLVN